MGDPVGWRFLIVAADQPVRTADVHPQPNDPNNPFVFASISAGLAAAIANAMQAAEADAVIAAGQYEVRLFQVPALYLCALWLKDRTGRADYFVVVPPAPAGFIALDVIPAAGFYRILSNLARQRRPPPPHPRPNAHSN